MVIANTHRCRPNKRVYNVYKRLLQLWLDCWLLVVMAVTAAVW